MPFFMLCSILIHLENHVALQMRFHLQQKINKIDLFICRGNNHISADEVQWSLNAVLNLMMSIPEGKTVIKM